MALQTQMLCSFENRAVVFFSGSLRIRSEKASDSDPTQAVPNKGKGFGSGSSKRKEKEKGGGSRKRERASIIRRSPVEKPAFVSEQEQGSKEQNNNESAFILAWLGFGSIILVEGIALAASGFLPEEWDKLFVKYLYPSFTPTVFLFVAGAVAYGVFKYLQNEKITEQK